MSLAAADDFILAIFDIPDKGLTTYKIYTGLDNKLRATEITLTPDDFEYPMGTGMLKGR